MKCPECKAEMSERSFEGRAGPPVLVDVCHTCRGLWFDTNESQQLSAAGTLRLFRELRGPRAGPRAPRGGPRSCPRCDAKLEQVHDMVRNQRFHATHCPQRHGHFITFFHFLREKGLVRDLRPRERMALREDVDTLLCSDCGEPVRLASLEACARCQAPLSLLDPQCMQDTVLDAQRALGSRRDVTPEVAARLVMDRLKLASFHARSEPPSEHLAPAAFVASAGSAPSSSGLDLFEDGLQLFADVLELLGLFF